MGGDNGPSFYMGDPPDKTQPQQRFPGVSAKAFDPAKQLEIYGDILRKTRNCMGGKVEHEQLAQGRENLKKVLETPYARTKRSVGDILGGYESAWDFFGSIGYVRHPISGGPMKAHLEVKLTPSEMGISPPELMETKPKRQSSRRKQTVNDVGMSTERNDALTQRLDGGAAPGGSSLSAMPPISVLSRSCPSLPPSVLSQVLPLAEGGVDSRALEGRSDLCRSREDVLRDLLQKSKTTTAKAVPTRHVPVSWSSSGPCGSTAKGLSAYDRKNGNLIRPHHVPVGFRDCKTFACTSSGV
eukprot:TRINITY_DN40795_c0_g1_i1.p1 TRINITY_DN40795_c0_g1~~TRINITY_DN40795_c0_g1_i1.p1  ORF type:complete len:298 (-),score=39.36 TRINITY_DN40795_c0_g1_i1:86-979(-)